MYKDLKYRKKLFIDEGKKIDIPKSYELSIKDSIRNLNVLIELSNTRIKNINNNLKNNSYLDETTTDSDDFGYYLEIIESIDSIAISIVIDSKCPYYKIRIGDTVRIDK